jgi:hypothetical protein
MYTSVWEFTRPTIDVVWPTGSAEFNELRNNAAGFIKKEISYENGGLLKKVRTIWESETAAMDFMDANVEAAAAVNSELIQYCETNNIAAVRSVE